MAEPLNRAECYELLSSQVIGRVAVAGPDEAPLVFPVNYLVDGESIVFRSDAGPKLDALRGHAASFEVDSFDPRRRTGWSVLIRGFGFETSPAGLDLQPWDGGPKTHWVRIFPGTVTGRRLTLPAFDPDPRGYL